MTDEGFRLVSMMDEKPLPDNPTGGWVQGQFYQAIVLGSEFVFWFPRKLKRSELKTVALEFAGADVYDPGDVDSVRAIKC